MRTRTDDMTILCIRDLGHDRFAVEIENATMWGEVELDADFEPEGTTLFVRDVSALGQLVLSNSDEVAEACLRARGALGGVWRPVRAQAKRWTGEEERV